MINDASDYLSLAALGVAGLGTWLNWRHTNKTFRHASNPELQITTDIREPIGNLWLRLDNLHNSVAASEIQCVVSIRWHTNRRTSWRAWINYYSKSIPPIHPLGRWEGLLEDHRLAIVLAKEFEAVRAEEIPRGSGRFDCFILGAQAWDIRVTVSYRGAVAGSSRLSVSKKFMVQPVPREHAYKLVQGGKEERKAVQVIEAWRCR